jgi:hypothetical protein
MALSREMGGVAMAFETPAAVVAVSIAPHRKGA